MEQVILKPIYPSIGFAVAAVDLVGYNQGESVTSKDIIKVKV